jgi:cobalamin biosynthesis protein CobD/CbiB
MAGALGLKLAGRGVYGEALVDDAFMGERRREAKVADIRRALRLRRRPAILHFAALATCAAPLIWRG